MLNISHLAPEEKNIQLNVGLWTFSFLPILIS